MAAQIKRIDRALDDCSRPLKLELLALQNALIRQVDAVVLDMQASQPEAVAEMLRLSKGVVTVSEDGTKAVSSRSGRLVWDIATQTSGLLRAACPEGVASDCQLAVCAESVCQPARPYAAADD